MQKERKNMIPVILLMMFCAIVISKTIFVGGSDDEFYSKIIKNGDTEILFVNNRILINAIVSLIEYGGIYVWRICNTIVCGLLFLYIIKITDISVGCEGSMCFNFGICSVFFLIPINVLSPSVFWATGSFNYLWGATAGLLFLFPFFKLLYGKECTRMEFVASFIGGIYAGNLEQISAVQVCFAILILAYCLKKKRKVEKQYWILFLISVISLCVLLILPFNRDRNIGAIAQYYPDWYMMSFLDKVYQGVVNIGVHLVDKAAILLTIFTCVVWIAICKTKNSQIIRCVAVLPCVYSIINILSKCGIFDGNIINIIYDIEIYKYQEMTSKMQLISVLILCIVVSLEAVLLWFIFKENLETFMFVFLLYGAGIASAFILAFSPTIFASANRIFFLMDLFLVIVIGIIIKKINIKELKNGFAVSFMIGLCGMDLVICIKYALLLHGVVWY